MVVYEKLGRCGEIGLGFGASELARSGVVGSCGFFRGVEGAKPDAGFLARVADLGGVAAPRAFPDASVANLFVGLCWAWAGSGECGGSVPWSHFFVIQIYQVFLFSSTGNTNREKSERSEDACGIETMSEGKKGSWSGFIAQMEREKAHRVRASLMLRSTHARPHHITSLPSHLFMLLATPLLPPHYTLFFLSHFFDL